MLEIWCIKALEFGSFVYQFMSGSRISMIAAAVITEAFPRL